jgi:hypothetical protein
VSNLDTSFFAQISAGYKIKPKMIALCRYLTQRRPGYRGKFRRWGGGKLMDATKDALALFQKLTPAEQIKYLDRLRALEGRQDPAAAQQDRGGKTSE